MEAKARSEGLQFAAIGYQDYPAGALAESVAKLSNLSGRAALKYSVESACNISNLILRDGPKIMQQLNIDALLIDQNEPSGGSVAEHLRIPFMSVCTSLPLNREPLIPPPFVGWQYSDSVFARARNRIGYAIADRLIAPIQAVLNKYRKNWNLGPISKPDDTFSRIAEIAQMPQEFDFPRERLPQTFHYLGPWFDERSSSSIPFPFENLDGRPIIYGSLGTLQSKDSSYFHVMAEACNGLEAQLVLSLGQGTGEAILNLPGKPVVVNYAPQLELLSRAAVTITHAGMNTTQQSLYFGVPAVAIPLAHDQPAIAARLARTGAGIVIPPGKLNPVRLRGAVSSLLSEGNEYRDRARQLQVQSRRAGGVNRAAELAESLLAE
ncbi:MAG: glycosyltransferase, family [Bryobacterales bacterium]|nr:glycosyltransferase, family [Bryobacterales bacterium]